MKEPTIETDYPISPEHWDYLTPTKTGRHSNVDLTGMRFNKWTVLGPEKYHEGSGWYWFCRCDCGAIRAVTHSALINGKSQSCGCLREDMQSRRHYFGSFYPDDADEKWQRNHRENE